MVYLPALRSAKTRLTVSVAFPVETSTLMLNFLLKASTTGRYWRDGAPPEAIDTVPSCCAAAMSLDHSCSKLALGAVFVGAVGAAAAAALAVKSTKAHRNDPTRRSDEPSRRRKSLKVF